MRPVVGMGSSTVARLSILISFKQAQTIIITKNALNIIRKNFRCCLLVFRRTPVHGLDILGLLGVGLLHGGLLGFLLCGSIVVEGLLHEGLVGSLLCGSFVVDLTPTTTFPN